MTGTGGDRSEVELRTSAAQAAPAGFTVRRVRPSDTDELFRFYEALSSESRRARFLAYGTGVSAERSRSFCTPDHMHGEGFVARRRTLAGDEGELVGHLCLEPVDERRLELAVAVADEEQGKGLGRALFEAAIDWAQQHGMDAIVATASADNSRVLRLLSSAPYSARLLPADGGVVEVVVPLVPELGPDLYVRSSAARPEGRRRARLRGARAVIQCRVIWRPRRDLAEGHAGGACQAPCRFVDHVEGR